MPQSQQPRQFLGVTISSTFTDLAEHRKAVIDALKRQGLHPIAMEHDTARADADVIESSLQFVRDGAAYIGIISRKYGQTPRSKTRNPDGLSITELEFNEAVRLERPILLFIMGERHSVIEADVETDPEKRKKLGEFRERAKRKSDDEDVHRVYSVFNGVEEFKTTVAHAVAKLKPLLESAPRPAPKAAEAQEEEAAKRYAWPRPPAFRAVPRYAGSHPFVGRAEELKALSGWATVSDPHPMFLLEAIGGSGKSMLAWQWINHHAPEVRGDWAGRFWYSFYERGAVMAQFCREALAYMTGEPMEDLRKLRILDLGDMLLAELTARPWLVVMDGLERVLVAYHRYNAPQLRDTEVSGLKDQISKRSRCAAINTEDDELLRRLATAAPSKLAVTSRLTPSTLLNRSHQPLPGVRQMPLPGLRSGDAEVMFRACGVTGKSEGIRAYLQQNCGHHPLVIGVLAGLVNSYLPDRGNFDRWAVDPGFGGRLNLASLDLSQRQNHILEAAFDALPPASRQLLSTLSLLSSAVDYETLAAFNPHSPPRQKGHYKSEEVEAFRRQFFTASAKLRRGIRDEHDKIEASRTSNPYDLEAWSQSKAALDAANLLSGTVRDLETRGLLQYDRGEKRYDLHPVVRGVTFGRMASDEKQAIGQQLVDHFSQQQHQPYELADSLDDLSVGLELVRGLLQLGRLEEAIAVYKDGLGPALLFNLDAYSEVISLFSPLFTQGLNELPAINNEDLSVLLLENISIALAHRNLFAESIKARTNALCILLRKKNLRGIYITISSIAEDFHDQNMIFHSNRIRIISRTLAEMIKQGETFFTAQFDLFIDYVIMGNREKAESAWSTLSLMGRGWYREVYRAGEAEYWRAEFLYRYHSLGEDYLVKAEKIANSGRSRSVTRQLLRLRGRWRLDQGEIDLATDALRETVRLARSAGLEDPTSEALLALARVARGHKIHSHVEAERLSAKSQESALTVAKLWQALGEREKAVEHALRAHRWAVADGEPYVRRWELNRTRELLTELGAELPPVPQFDPAKHPSFPWEKDLLTAIEELRAEKKREKAIEELRAEKESEKAQRKH
jgi:tetratricopeptide (TPR) repeat protein